MPRVVRRLLALLLVPALLPAQAPAGERPVAVVADSIAAAGDTVAAIAQLEDHLRRHARDASAWHKVGVLAWAKSRPARSTGFIADQADIRRIRLADSSLRLAHYLAPDSARFAVDLARYFLGSAFVQLRLQSYALFDDAIAAASRAGDSALVAEAADEKGMVYWRRYESVANRVLKHGVFGIDLLHFANDPQEIRTYLAKPLARGDDTDDWSGQLDYFQASDAFKRALGANPGEMRAVKHAYMALAERARWEELRTAARTRLAVAPWDPYSWLALGLASHRMNHEPEAAAAFDSALVNLGSAERQRFVRLSRILVPGGRADGTLAHAAAYDSASPARRALMDSLYWQVADPLVMTRENEHRLEFLARVAFAELRWSSDDFDVHGADSDRGDVEVRYGPPDLAFSMVAGPGLLNTIWAYRNGLAFVFAETPTYGIAFLSFDNHDQADRNLRSTPVRWDNVPIARDLDTIPTLATRFRAAGDSLDLLLAARLPAGRLTRSVDLRRPAVDVELRVYSTGADLLRRDSSRIVTGVLPGDTTPETRVWRERVPPSAQLWRIEALQPESMHAARAIGLLPRLEAAGFAVSDLLVAQRVQPREGSAGGRWSDFAIVPSLGVFHRRDPVALLWETYDLASDSSGGSRYHVQVTLEQVRSGGALAIAARIIGGAAEGLHATGKGKVSLGFERAIASRAAVADYVTLDLGDAPPGDWTLSLEVTDLATRHVARTSRVIRIEE